MDLKLSQKVMLDMKLVHILLAELLERGLFFFIFISTPEGHERGTFWRIIISFQSGTENID